MEADGNAFYPLTHFDMKNAVNNSIFGLKYGNNIYPYMETIFLPLFIR